ncbi:hypothetical protein SLS53_006470 [Cytospora paraplurivora]|uniref:Involucrin repeat protein n=1 Tax=Cytospora paraplurivora TaxID=2898453 RepID=A0AAN9YD95_9PEZI
MSDRRRRWSPESSRRRRKDRRVSREQSAMDEIAAADSRSMAPGGSYSSTNYPYPSQVQGQVAASSFQQTALAADQHALPPITLRSNDDTRPSRSKAAPMPMPGPLRGYERERNHRRNRNGSRSSSDSSPSSSSSSSYLDISRWYPSFGRGGGVLNTFFKTPSEHKQKVRRRRSGRMKKQGIFGFGNNSSSSSVNSDLAYGMGFVKKPKNRGYSPRGGFAASGREKRDGKPPRLQRRQTDEEIMDIGRKLAKIAREQNKEDLRSVGKRPAGQVAAAASSWEQYHQHNSSGPANWNRGLPPSKSQRHETSSSDDEEWESASEGEYSSDESSGLAYGAVEFEQSPPSKSSSKGQSSNLPFRRSDRKSSAVDPKLFGPVNSLRGIVHTPCGFGDRNSMYTVPGPSEPRRTSTAESATIEARPLQMVYPVQTTDPGVVEAVRPSGSFVSAQQSYSRDQSYWTGRPEPVAIQAPKPVAPVPMRLYEEERLRDEPSESRGPRRVNPAGNKIFAETALVGAGVAAAAMGEAVMADRDKGKDKDRELDLGYHEKYGHDDHRQNDTKVQDSRRAEELALEKEIERLEKVLAEREKARQQRLLDSKREAGDKAPRETDADANPEVRHRDQNPQQRGSGYDRDYHRHHREEERSETSRVSEPSVHPAVVDDVQNRTVASPRLPSSSGIDVFQFEVPDDAFSTRDSPARPSSPLIIDVSPALSPEPDQMGRKSRRDSFEDEMRDAKHIYEESTKSTAPISAVDMAAAIAATEHSSRYDEPQRGRTNAKQRDAVQEEADRYYSARRMAEREVRSRSRSQSPDGSVVEKYDQDRAAEIPRILTPPEMLQKPQKNKYSEPNADVTFDHLLSPKDLVSFAPKECPVRDPSAERPRPVLTLVMPTPVPTPCPEGEEESSATRSPESLIIDAPDIVLGPRGEVIEVTQSAEAKKVSWGPSQTKQYEVESPERSRERPSQPSGESKESSKSRSWGSIAAAFAGVGAAAALAREDEPERSKHREQVEDSDRDIPSEALRSSPPRDRKVLPKGVSSRVLDEEPEDAPPAPGPKPASPRSSQIPGAFADDLDFAATLAAGLQDTGFDPNIVIEDATYRRRDSPPGLNEPTAVYIQPFAETVTDLGAFGIYDDGVPVREPGHVLGEVAETPASEKGPPLDDVESAPAPREQSEAIDNRLRGDSHELPPVHEASKLSKKEQRRLEKAARAAQLAEEEARAAQPVDAGDDEWDGSPTIRKSKKPSNKSKRSSAGWDDAETPVNDKRVSVPVDDADDVKDAKAPENAWDELENKPDHDPKGYDLREKDPSGRRERRREERRRSEFDGPLDKDATWVMSDTRYNALPESRNFDDEGPVVSNPGGKGENQSDKRSSKDEKRVGGGLWGLLKGSKDTNNDKDSKKDKAGILGASAGIAGAALEAAITASSLPSSSDAAEAPSEEKEPHVIVDVNKPSAQLADSNIEQDDSILDDPDIVHWLIKPAIDPQYGDLLPLPPSPPGEADSTGFQTGDELPPLPESRPATPPGYERGLLRERSESSQRRPAYATHSRRRSGYETPVKSPSHTAIPLQFRMGPRSSVPSSPAIARTPPTTHTSPAAPNQEVFPSMKRHSRPASWDRPTSWDTSREIRPLYLLERSRGVEQESDHTPEMTPLPPSRASPAPEYKHDEDPEDAPLFIDTAAAQAAPLGSEESTPKGLRGSGSASPESAKEPEFIYPEISGPEEADTRLRNLDKNLEMAPVEIPSQSSFSESNYATPFESPRDNPETRTPVERQESIESTPDFRDALDIPADDEDTDTGSPKKRSKGRKSPSMTPELEPASEQETKGYFPAVLPAATLAGVDTLLDRGEFNELPSDVNDCTNEIQGQPSLLERQDQTDEREILPRAEASEVELVSPTGSGDQWQFPPAADPRISPTDRGDASLPNDWPAAHMHPERSLSIDHMQETGTMAHGFSGADSDLPALDSQVMETTGVPSAPLAPHTFEINSRTTSPENEPEDMETIPETPADTVDWIARSRSTEKGESTEIVSDAFEAPITDATGSISTSDVQQDVPIQDEPLSKEVDEVSPAIEAIATSPVLHQSGKPFTEESGAEPGDNSEIKSKEPEGSPHQLPDEIASESLVHEPGAMPVAFEDPASPVVQSHTLRQDDSCHVGDRPLKSSAANRRLRSSRASISTNNSMDDYMSSDAVHSGEDVPTSPHSTTGSGHRTTGRRYKKTRSLRSSRRSSMASSQGSNHDYEAAPIEEMAEQLVAAVSGQTQAEGVNRLVDNQHNVEVLEPAEPATIDNSVSRQCEIAEESISSHPEAVEEPIPSQSKPIEEPVPIRPATVDEPSITRLEDVDQPTFQSADTIEELSSCQGEVLEAPASGQSGIFSEPLDSAVTPVREGQGQESSQTTDNNQYGETSKDEHSNLIERLDESPESGKIVDEEVADVQEPDLPESLTPEITEAVDSAREVIAEESLEGQGPQALADTLVQPSEPETNVQEGSQEQTGFVHSSGPEEQVLRPFSSTIVEETARDVARGDDPVRQIEKAVEVERPIPDLPSEEDIPTMKEDLSEAPPQESESTSLPMKGDTPVSSSISERNERHRDTVASAEPTKSTDIATPAESVSVAQPAVESAELPSPVHGDTQAEQLTLESQGISTDRSSQPQAIDGADQLETSKLLDSDDIADEPSEPRKLLEPEVSLAETSEPIESIQSMEPIVLPVNRDVPAAISTLVPQDSALETKGELGKSFENDELARREAEAGLIQREKADIARLQNKKKLKPKEKQRLRDLRANAERRAERANVASAAQPPSDQAEGQDRIIAEGEVVEPQLLETNSGSPLEERTLPQTGEPTLIGQDTGLDRSTDVPEPKQILIQPEVILQAEDIVPETDMAPGSGKKAPPLDWDSSPAEPRPAPPGSDNIEQSDQREAETSVIQKEEVELARLGNRKNRSKKDKARMRVLKANAEQRAQEAAVLKDIEDNEPSQTEQAISGPPGSQAARDDGHMAQPQAEGTSPGVHADSGNLTDASRHQPVDANQLQTKEAASGRNSPTLQDESPTVQSGLENTSQEFLQGQSNGPRDFTVTSNPHLGDSNKASLEPIPSTEIPHEENSHFVEIPAIAGPEQPIVTDSQQEPEPGSPITSRKSKRDRKKKRKGTSSDASGDNQGTAIVTAAEPSVGEPSELSETVPLHAQDSEAATVPVSSEDMLMTQGQPSAVRMPEGVLPGNVGTGEVALAQPAESNILDSPDQFASTFEQSNPSQTPLEEKASAILSEQEQMQQPTESGSLIATEESHAEQNRGSTILEGSHQQFDPTRPAAMDDVEQLTASAEPTENSEREDHVEEPSAHIEGINQAMSLSSPAPESPATPTPREPESAQEHVPDVFVDTEARQTFPETATPTDEIGETSPPAQPLEVPENGSGRTEGIGAEPLENPESKRTPSVEQKVEASDPHKPTGLSEDVTRTNFEAPSTIAPVVSEPEQIVAEPEQGSPTTSRSDGWGFLAGAIAGIGTTLGLAGADDEPLQRNRQITDVTAEQDHAQDVESSEKVTPQDAELVDKVEHTASTISKDEGTSQDTGRELPREQRSTNVIMIEPETTVQGPDPTQDNPFEYIAIKPEVVGNQEASATLDIDPENVAPYDSHTQVGEDQQEVPAQLQLDTSTASKPLDTTQDEFHLPKSDFQPTDSERAVAASEREISVQPQIRDSTHPYIAEETLDSGTVPKSNLEGKIEEGDDTVIVAGGKLVEGVTESTSSQQRWPNSTEQARKRADVDIDQSSFEPSSLDFEGDNNLADAFTTPMERPPILSDEKEPMHARTSGGQTEEAPLNVVDEEAKHEKHSRDRGSPSWSLDVEPEPSTSVPETPLFEEAVEQQTVKEPPETYDVAEKSVDPALEAFGSESGSEQVPKEDQKAKKDLASVSEPEIVTPVSADDSERTIGESAQPREILYNQGHAPADVSASRGTQQVDPYQQGFDQGSSGGISNVIEKKDPEHSFLMQDISSPLPKHSTQVPQEQVAESTASEGADSSIDQPMESKLSKSVGEETPVLSRKSKKERRRAKKAAALASEDDDLEPSQPRTPLTEETQPRNRPAQSSPVLKPDPVQSPTYIEHQLAYSLASQDSTASAEDSVAIDPLAEGWWAAPLSRQKSDKDLKKKGKQPATEPAPIAEDAPVPLTTEMRLKVPEAQETLRQVAEDAGQFAGRDDHRSAEMYIPESHATPGQSAPDAGEPTSRVNRRSAELYVPVAETSNKGEGAATNEGLQEIPTTQGETHRDSFVSGSTSPKTPAEEASPTATLSGEAYKPTAGTSEAFGDAKSVSNSPDIEGRELQKKESSPDPWDSEDYFKPKPDNFGEPPEEAFNSFEFNPAVARDFNSRPDTRIKDDRPLVGLGLIRRHSSIFLEDDGHIPKLLTMASYDSSTAQVFTAPHLDDHEQAATASRRPSHITSQDTSTSNVVKGPTKTGSVAALAEKFESIKKANGKSNPVPRNVAERSEDDTVPGPAMWERAEPRPAKGHRLDVDPADLRAVPHTEIEDEQLDPDVHPGQGASTTSHGRETQFGNDNVSETRSQQSELDARKFTPPVPEQASPEAESLLGELLVVESPIPGQQSTIDIPILAPQPSIDPPDTPSDLDAGQKADSPSDTTDTAWQKPLHVPHGSPSPRSQSPASERGLSLGEAAIPSSQPPHEDLLVARRSVVDLRRSPSGGLPPVQEDPHEEEAEAGKKGASLTPGVATRDIDRDSGFVTDSPVLSRIRQFEKSQQQRDSGVDMRDSPRTSPRLLGTRAFSPQPARLSQSSLEDEGAKLEDQSSRRPSPARSDSQRGLREATPVLEAQEPPVTPEPQKSRSTYHKKYPDLGPSPGKAGPATAVAGGATLLARDAATSPAGSLRTNRPTTPTRSPTSSNLKKATTPAAAQTNLNPVANEGRVRAKDMADVYDGFGEGRMGSPRSPTRPHSMRRRQSMQVLELESRVEQLIAENRALHEASSQAQLHTTSQATSTLAERDTEIEALKQSLEFMRREIQRLTEVNEGLNSAIQQTAVQYDDRYRLLESQYAEATRQLHEYGSRHDRHAHLVRTIEEKDEEIRSLREELEDTKEQIREMQAQILANKPADSDFLRIKDVDYFDHRCQQLCSHVQQWVLRFSKFSDMRACRLTSELNDEKIIDRLDNAVLDGSNVDHYLNDRVRRRDVFMSVTMTMIWEFVFTRYLFGMDREQRQKLKTLEKLLLEVGPTQAVRQWRAVTLTLLAKRDSFKDQRDQDTEAVVQAIFQTLTMILPPPSNLEDQIQNQLRKVMREAVDLSIEMRTQRAEYMMLPPMQPEYDANGDLAEPHPFNAALMNERGSRGDKTAEELEAEGAIVRVVLFPLVVKKGDDDGVGDDEIVVCPAQVIVAKLHYKSRLPYNAPSSDAGGASLLHGGSPSTGHSHSRSNVSMRDVGGGMEGAI